ncbi:hypothetical protein [Bradyrhizobium elkanii]|uniref:hypothetical protein n=1 Tax=Bradyrhizobium elkanii TaxID=29448 RepID=UPI00056ED8B0|nr:hypothetical protein [Bradyrhizobium elkanii]WLA78807.1 hypothetical protein QNJ99_25630 [Bradyrhizobium elkanii]
MGLHEQNRAYPQRLVACIAKSGREQFRITLKDYSDGETKAEIRIFERHRDHDWEATPRHVVIGRDYLLSIVEGLLEAAALLKQEAA